MDAFRAPASFHDFFLGRDAGGIAGEMQVFENLAPEVKKRIPSAIAWTREVNINLAIDSSRR